MNNNLKCALTFISGAAIGSVVTWRLLKSKYEKLTQEGIESYKEAIAQQKNNDAPKEESIIDEQKETSTPMPSPEDIEVADQYAAKLKILGYTENEPDVEIAMPEEESDENEGEEEYETMNEVPYVIDPKRYGEINDYGTETLAFYADGVLADNTDESIDDVEGLVGDAWEHIGDYEENVVHVRNEKLKCDYEILFDSRTFNEYKASMPRMVPYRPEE